MYCGTNVQRVHINWRLGLFGFNIMKCDHSADVTAYMNVDTATHNTRGLLLCHSLYGIQCVHFISVQPRERERVHLCV